VVPKPLHVADRNRYHATHWRSSGLSPGVQRQQAQLATAENLTTMSILTRDAPNIRPDNPSLFKNVYPAGYPAEYRILKIAGYPAINPAILKKFPYQFMKFSKMSSRNRYCCDVKNATGMFEVLERKPSIHLMSLFNLLLRHILRDVLRNNYFIQLIKYMQ
jgi:hypothetical protein